MRSIRLLSSIKGLLGFHLLPLPPHVFSVGPDSLGFAGFTRAGRDLELARMDRVDLPPETFHEGLLGGPLKDPEVFDRSLGELLARLEEPVTEASLVLPDAWMRIAFTSSAPLPSRLEARDEILRWKLRRLVPFRVDELRIAADEVAALPGREIDPEEPCRLLLAFALDTLLSQLEDAFERAGVRIGQIVNSSLSALSSVVPENGDGLVALALVETDGYTLSFARGRDPVLQRHKGATGGLDNPTRTGLVQRDLKLTRNFLEEQLPGEPLQGVLVAAPPELEPLWIEWLEQTFGSVVEPLSRRHLPLRPIDPRGPEPAWNFLAPMLGAARQEVA